MEISLFIFSFFLILSSSLVIISTNPIYSILALILSFLNSIFILLMLNIEFLAMLFFIIYIGAVAILFLFVIMMLNIKLIEVKNKYIIHFPLLLILIIFFSISIYFSLNSLFNVHSINLTTNLSYLDYYDVIYTNQTKLNEFGFTLFYWHYLNFILVGIVLLIAMLGAIYLTLNVSYNSKRQDIFTQLNRENSINYIT